MVIGQNIHIGLRFDERFNCAVFRCVGNIGVCFFYLFPFYQVGKFKALKFRQTSSGQIGFNQRKLHNPFIRTHFCIKRRNNYISEIQVYIVDSVFGQKVKIGKNNCMNHFVVKENTGFFYCRRKSFKLHFYFNRVNIFSVRKNNYLFFTTCNK